jgi:hypothetical protein
MYNIYVHLKHDTRDLYSYTYTQILCLLVNIQLYSNGIIILNTCTIQVDSMFSLLYTRQAENNTHPKNKGQIPTESSCI